MSWDVSRQGCVIVRWYPISWLTGLFTVGMKKLIAAHKDELSKYSDLDLDDIQNITYLHEFDRKIQ